MEKNWVKTITFDEVQSAIRAKEFQKKKNGICHEGTVGVGSNIKCQRAGKYEQKKKKPEQFKAQSSGLVQLQGNKKVTWLQKD